MRVERQITYKLQMGTGSALRRLVGEPWAHTRPGWRGAGQLQSWGGMRRRTVARGRSPGSPQRRSCPAGRAAGEKILSNHLAGFSASTGSHQQNREQIGTTISRKTRPNKVQADEGSPVGGPTSGEGRGCQIVTQPMELLRRIPATVYRAQFFY